MRVLLGVGAWILGATAATGGSLFAVDRMGQDLLAQYVQQISISTVNTELALEHSPPAATSPALRPARSPSARIRHGRKSARSAPSAVGMLVVSPDGSAEAACQAADVYLVYWSPQQGYEADHVIRGPAAVAQVTFRNGDHGVVLRVTCRAGVPVKHISAFQRRSQDD